MLEHAVNMTARGPTNYNLYELEVALSKEWVNLPQRSNNKLMKYMPREIEAVVKAHRCSI